MISRIFSNSAACVAPITNIIFSGLPHAEAVRKTGFTAQTFYNIRDNRGNPNFSSVMEMSEAFGMSLDELCGTRRGPKVQRSEATGQPDQNGRVLEVQNEGLAKENELLREQIALYKGLIMPEIAEHLKKSVSVNNSTYGQMSLIGFDCFSRRREKPMRISFRDARGTTVIFPRQAPLGP